MRKLYLLPIFLVLFVPVVQSQYVVTTPTFPKDTGSVAITVDVSKGNKALFNYPAPDKVYIHTGVILGDNASPWDSVPFTWGTANAAAKVTSLGNNKYRYTIADIRALYQVPANVPIRKIAFLLRDEAGNTVQRNADGSDMYIQLYGSPLASKFLQPASEPTFVPKSELIQKNVGDNVSVAYASNKPALLRLFYDGTKVGETNGTLIDGSILVNTPGNHQIIATSTAGSENVADTINFFVASPVAIAPLPTGVRDGINYEAGDTSVVMVLYAPGKQRVAVIGDFNNWTESAEYQMNITPDGKRFWVRIKGLVAGKEYGLQYLVNSTLRIAEPYAEKVLDPDNDSFIPSSVNPEPHPYPTGKTTGIVSIIQTAATPYTWQSTSFQRPDKRTMAVYELLLRDFLAAPNWQTLKDTIGYLKRLGINAIELMPFNEFEGNLSWGYNPSFYFAPDKYYGTKNKLKEFIDLAHQNGIAVIMDIALNHSFSQSPLVQLYFDNANNRPDPSNPWFNPAAKHAFNVGYDMNHESAATKYFTSRVVEHWLKEYRIDGFRFDLSKGFTQKKTCDDAGGNCDVGAWSAYDASRVAI
ncbi:MAG TPA: alpha-amylase family glycosyl hydrolase, partial [Flavitalea sp.]|nr:alpha-amylase family glycosyl hydrolase [Flavitalea sp.]